METAVSAALCCLAVLACASPALVISLDDQGAALLSLRNSASAADQLSSWNPADGSPCSWRGVRCRKGKVVYLSLTGIGFTGLLPPALGNLSALRYINLTGNTFSGNLPAGLFQNFRGLQSLILAENSFSGPLPAELGGLRHLESLDLSRNRFEGPIPSSLTQCQRLKNLYLGQNRLEGALPTGLDKMARVLQNLNASFNRLSGSIPAAMGDLQNLQGILDLSHNHFSGSIPASLGNVSDAVFIDLSFNNLSGAIPPNSLTDRGPTAFMGNPLLCGQPLTPSCPYSPSSTVQPAIPDIPADRGGAGSSRGRKTAVTVSLAIVLALFVGAVVGISVATLSICRRKFRERKCSKALCGDGRSSSKETRPWFCLPLPPAKEEEEEEESEAGGHRHRDHQQQQSQQRGELVLVDLKGNFDLDELLQATAVVLEKTRTGILYRVKIREGLPVLAVRRLGGAFQQFRDFQTEAEAIAKIKHPNIVSLRAYYWSPEERLLIYDFMPNGNLASAIHGNAAGGGALPWPVRLGIIKGTAKGLAYLHEMSPRKHVHGNLKPTNVLLGPNMEPLISDFGLSQAEVGSSHRSGDGGASTPPGGSSDELERGSRYRAPETSSGGGRATQKWDVYSFGVLLLEVIFGRPAEVGRSEMELVEWIRVCVEEEGSPLPYILDPCLARDVGRVGEEAVLEVIKIGLSCAQASPQSRPAMKQVAEALHRIPVPRH